MKICICELDSRKIQFQLAVHRISNPHSELGWFEAISHRSDKETNVLLISDCLDVVVVVVVTAFRQSLMIYPLAEDIGTSFLSNLLNQRFFRKKCCTSMSRNILLDMQQLR